MQKIIHYCWFGEKTLPKMAKKCIRSWKRFLPDFEIKEWNETNVNINECAFIREAYKNKKWAFVADYVRTKVLNEYGGLYLDTDMEITKNIDNFLEDETFLGIEDSGYVAVGVWYEKNSKSYLTTQLLEKYRSLNLFDVENITKISIPIFISGILDKNNLKKSCEKIQTLDYDVKIYPREYFYPYSYYKNNNVFTKNTCMIHHYDASWLPFKLKMEKILITKLGEKNSYRLINLLRKGLRIMKKCVKCILFPIFIYRHIKVNCIADDEKKRTNNTILEINKNKNKKYITFYNKFWFGITSSTIELFDNLVDCGEIHRKKNIKRIANAILKNNINQVVFSSFAYGWKELIEYLKEKNPNIKVKTFWHGSHSQILDSYGWERNLEIISLHKVGNIDAIGTCKKSLLNFYKAQGFKAYFITNKVSVDRKKQKKHNKGKNDKVVVGIYAAKCDDWRKNMFTQLASVALLDNAVADMVPLNQTAKKFAEQIKLILKGVDHSIPRKQLLDRLSKNDLNLYITFSECAPMLPLESMELGIPCITGNNHHYFEKSELEKYVIVNNEMDVEEITEKIKLCIKNKDLIINLYNKFSEENIKENEKNVKEFLKI